MYSHKHNLLIGFHGCDKDVAMSIVTHKESMKFSMNDYDWLGHGMYFWEDNLERAYQWAVEMSKRKEPHTNLCPQSALHQRLLPA